MAAAQELLARGGAPPSVADIAAAADVSRRTVYMYFPTLEQLLIDATQGALTSDAGVEASIEAASATDARARVEALARSVVKLTDATLPAGRRMIALTVESPPPPDAPLSARRGRRRMSWIEKALEPVRAKLTKEQYERVASALAVVIGWEAMIVLRDVQGLSPAREAKVTAWAATALVEAMLNETRRLARSRSG